MIEPFKVQSFNRLLIFSFSLAAAYDAYPFQFAQVIFLWFLERDRSRRILKEWQRK